jgi:hydroxylamine reductase
MNCNQCEQTFQGTGCVSSPGVCGKDDDIQGLQELLLYGVKGMAAYSRHARQMGYKDDSVAEFIESAMYSTMTNVNFDFDSTLQMVLKCGEMNLKVMEMLNKAHVETFGTPEPTKVYEGTKAGPGILVTGHDLKFLSDLLEQTAGTGVNVYTHGEMLPAHGYPKLKKHKHLVGHFGDAWQKQKKEFVDFTGPILATTNCILIPKEEYKDRLFTVDVVGVPGGTAIKNNDYSALIKKAKTCKPLVDHHEKTTEVGHHFTQILGLAGKLIPLIEAGKIKRVFVIGGCDGAEPGRNYYSTFAAQAPQESLILTLGCGKYRIRSHDYGQVEGIPRLLDLGQCNDAYGAIQLAVALAGAFKCGVNDLPLTLVISWFEQKAVAVLLTLLHLGVKGIRIGPKPPAFITPKLLGILQKNYDLRLITAQSDPLKDLAEVMAPR